MLAGDRKRSEASRLCDLSLRRTLGFVYPIERTIAVQIAQKIHNPKAVDFFIQIETGDRISLLLNVVELVLS